MWKDIHHQPQAVMILQQSVAHGRVAHAYLFAGPQGVAKEQAAIQLAKSIFCRFSRDGDSCESCIDCQRIQHHNHPDLHVIEPDGASIKIEQIRALRKEFQYQAVEGSRKVYIIHAADTMTIPAANSLLKFLEEPVGEVTAILLTDKPHSILPTIRSRCQLIPFHDEPWQSVADQLIAEGIKEADAKVASQITKNIDDAKSLCQSELFAELRKVVIQFYQENFANKANVYLQFNNKILLDARFKDEHNLFIELSILWFQDLLRLLFGRTEEVANVDALMILQEQAKRETVAKIAGKIDVLLKVQNRLKFMNPQLALEQMVLQLSEVHAGK